MSFATLFRTLLQRLWLICQDRAGEAALVGMVLVVALTLRFWFIPTHLNWNGDTARDALVARHLAVYGEALQLGHTAYGLRIFGQRDNPDPFQLSHYPTDFFAFLAMFWQFGGDVWNVARLAAVWQVLGLVILYLGVRKATDRWVALVTVLICSVSSLSLLHSLTVGTIQLSLPLVFMAFTLSVYAIKCRRPPLLLAAMVVGMAVLPFHYAALVIAGWIVLITLDQAMPFPTPRQRWLTVVTLLAIAGVMFALFHLQVVKYFGWPAVRQSLLTMHPRPPQLAAAVTQTQAALAYRLKNIYPHYPWVLVAVSLVVLGWSYRLRPNNRGYVQFLAGYLALMLVFMLTRHPDTFQYEQIMYLDYVYLAMLGVGIATLLRQPALTSRASGVIFTAVVLWSVSQGFRFAPRMELFVPVQAARQYAQQLLANVPDLSERAVFVSSYYSTDWESPTLVFWLEVESGQRFVSLRQTYNNYGWTLAQLEQPILVIQRLPQRAAPTAAAQSQADYFLTQRQYRQTTSLPDHPYFYGAALRRGPTP